MSDEAHRLALKFARAHPTEHVDFAGDRVVIGRAEELDEREHRQLQAHLDELGPWRKGPFSIFGHEIDANWKCDRKWERVVEFADPLRDKIICDVGTGNGYYLFRMAAHRPRAVLGLDPTALFQRCFEFLNAFRPTPVLEFQPLGFESLDEPAHHARYDLIFCMGIVYHHTDPMRLLRTLRAALRPGGQLIVESLALPASYSSDPVALCPARGRYAGGGGNWFVPNSLCLQQWLVRGGFRQVAAHGEFDFRDEQVRTAELPGLRDYLDPARPDRTIEGYPTPVRTYFSARR
jgi:tRNA (mo5U34)-methyltransferase